jgi:uncharacterized lipoprotein YmbA
MRAAGVLAVAAACAGHLPDTHYYQLAQPTPSPLQGEAIVAIDALEVDSAYDDERIVYRTSPYRLDYYEYERWASAPGAMITDFLASSLARTGHFHALPRETRDAPVVLGGRVIAIEEIDETHDRWVGHLAVALTLSDAHTGATVWAERFDEREPLANQTPEGLAAALSVAMKRIVDQAAPSIADVAMRTKAARPMANRAPGR